MNERMEREIEKFEVWLEKNPSLPKGKRFLGALKPLPLTLKNFQKVPAHPFPTPSASYWAANWSCVLRL